MPYSQRNLDRIFNRIHKIINKLFRNALKGLFNCEKFKNHRNGETYKNFQKGFYDGENYNVMFVKNYPNFNGDATTADDNLGNMLIHDYALKKIFLYSAMKILANDENDRELDDGSNKYFFELTGFMAHEMIHFFASHKAYYDENNILFECETHCLQQKCLDKNHTATECTDEYCEDGDSCVFSLCNKKPPLMAFSRRVIVGGPITMLSMNFELDQNPYEPVDHGDDNYSVFSGNFSQEDVYDNFHNYLFPNNPDFFELHYYPDFLVYSQFNYADCPILLNRYRGFSYFEDYSHDFFPNDYNALIIPSGQFIGDEDSMIVKEAIKTYVENGGTIVVLAQQYGSHFEKLLPIPEG